MIAERRDAYDRKLENRLQTERFVMPDEPLGGTGSFFVAELDGLYYIILMREVKVKVRSFFRAQFGQYALHPRILELWLLAAGQPWRQDPLC